MCLIPSHRGFSDEEIQRIWFHRDEYEMIMCNNKALIQMMMTWGNFTEDDKDVCFRGLVDENTRKRRTEYRREAIESLLWEQQRQYMSGIFDDEKLRNAVVPRTEAAVQEAIARAREDRLACHDKLSVLEEGKTNLVSYRNPSLVSALALNNDVLLTQPQRKQAVAMSQNVDLAFLLDDALAVLESPTCP